MRTQSTRFLALAAFFFVFTFAACDSDPSALVDEEATATELTDLAARLSTDLDLSTEQAQAINSLVTVSGDEKPVPGHLWTVAAGLQKTLTDEQKAMLFENLEQRTAELAEGMKSRRFNQGDKGNARRFQRQGDNGAEFLNLTPEQQEHMKALREANRAEMKALMEARKDGSLSEDDFREQAKALREKNHEAMQALLTDEQKATLEEKRAERKSRFGDRREAAAEAKEIAATARAEALGLTADQEAALASMQEEHQAARKALAEKIRAGDVDREGVKAEFETFRAANQAALTEILTPEQLETVEIHNALAGGLALRRAGRRGARGFGRVGN